MDLNTLYGVLRAQLLSRHFALSRYFRADYPSYYNNLGVVHQASVGKRVFYVDGARHVHALSAQPDGSWADTDLIAAMGAPAGDGTGLSGCQWADGSEQVFYLDASGDVHELATTADGQWADLNLTQRTGAPAAVANSALSAYQWAAGNSKQVVYLDVLGHVHELSVTAGGQWAHIDLTKYTGAPAAWTLSSLPGYQWVAGKSKQVVYLDAAGHVHELSGTVGRRWAHTDLTQRAGAPAAGARSRLSGYEWADGKSKQVVYLDADDDTIVISLDISSPTPAKIITTNGTPDPDRPGQIRGFFRLPYTHADPAPAYIDDATVYSNWWKGQMTPGSSDTPTIVAVNTGSTTWTPAADYRLGSQVPADNTTWGTARVDLPITQVDPQDQAVFTFSITAPTLEGQYAFSWQMVRDPDDFFGSGIFPAEMVTVAPDGAPVVPDVVGSDASSAEQEILAAGLKYKAVMTGASDHGTVIMRRPTAGVITRPGALVTIWIATGRGSGN